MKTTTITDTQGTGCVDVSLLTERYLDKIGGVLSCFDRLVIMGTIPDCCHSEAMMHQMYIRQIRLFDYPMFANRLREQLRANAETIAKEDGLKIEFIRQHFRKENRIEAILKERGTHPGLVHIFSAMEPCSSFQPWYDKRTKRTILKPDSGKCLHYYFYFIDEDYGLCYLRVPTWAPFRLQFYCNVHNWLSAQLRRRRIGFEQVDNVFVGISDFGKAQALADSFDVRLLHKKMDAWARRYCSVVGEFQSGYHWSLMQVEYATDIVFKSRQSLAPLYEEIVRSAVHAVKADDVATFLGKKMSLRYEGDAGNRFNVRLEGTRVRHCLGPVSLKTYDKLGLVLRLETTSNDVSFFKHHRKVKQRDGTCRFKLANVKKSIYSLPVLCELMYASNQRYLRFLSALEDNSQGPVSLDTISRPMRDASGRSFRGFNLFSCEDLNLLLALLRGEHQISGLTNRLLQKRLPGYSGPRISRFLKRLHLHRIIRKIGKTYKYYLTRLGQKLLLTALKLRERLVIPTLAQSVVTVTT
jgi:hypothetical protein